MHCYLLGILYFATITVWISDLWARELFSMCAFGGLAFRASTIPIRVLAVFSPLAVIGVVQLALGITVVEAVTVESTVDWAAAGAVFVLGWSVGITTRRSVFLVAAAWFGIVLALWCLVCIGLSEARFLGLWHVPRISVIYGPFGYHNNWAQFAELMLPVVLWQCMARPAYWLIYVVGAGLLLASVVGSGSRAGTVVCFGVLALFLVSVARRYRFSGISRRLLIAAPAAALLFSYLGGWQFLARRFRSAAGYEQERQLYLEASINMIRERPLLGWGLGTWSIIYPHVAKADDYTFINRAHNDWAEFASEGGVLFVAALAAPFFRAFPWMFRQPWSLGIIGVLVHACVDYPFARPGVSGWLFALLGLLYGSRDRGGSVGEH